MIPIAFTNVSNFKSVPGEIGVNEMCCSEKAVSDFILFHLWLGCGW